MKHADGCEILEITSLIYASLARAIASPVIGVIIIIITVVVASVGRSAGRAPSFRVLSQLNGL